MSGLQVLAPLGLVALLAVPAILLFHMRHTTPEPRPVPTLRFWLIAQETPTERARLRRPPLSILLILQLLVAAALAVALIRPATADAWTSLGLRTEPKHIIILLDGSTSMSAIDTPSGQTRFEEARSLALDRVADLQAGDVATVVLLGTRVTTFEATAAADFPAFRARLSGLRPPGGRADLDAALSLTRDLLLPKLENEVYLFSDGALSVDPTLVSELGAPIELIRVGGHQVGLVSGNVAITDIEARPIAGSPDRQSLWLRIGNFSDAPVTAPIVLTTDGLEQGRRTEVLPPGGQFVEIDWGELPIGTAEVSVAVEVADAFPADDRASLILRQESALTLRILLVTDVPGDLARALGVLPGAELTIEPSDSLALQTLGSTYDLVVYENTAPPGDSLPDAALLFVRPTPDSPYFPQRGSMATPTIVNALPHDPLLSGVEIAGLTFGETPIYDLPEPAWTWVVEAESGPLVAHGTLEGHPAVVLAFDVAASNIGNRPAFPILIKRIASQLVPSPLPSSVPLGDPLVYRPSTDAVAVRVTSPGGGAVELNLPPASDAGEETTLREIRFTDTGRPGEYRLVELGADGTELGGGRFIVNAGHITESDLRPEAELPALLATAQAATRTTIGSDLFDLWPIFAAAALALLTFEWLLALMPRRRQPAIALATSIAGVERGRRDSRDGPSRSLR